jgi:hypothetical protein
VIEILTLTMMALGGDTFGSWLVIRVEISWLGLVPRELICSFYHVKTQREWISKKALTRHWISWHLDLVLSRLKKNKFLLFTNYPLYNICYSSPKVLDRNCTNLVQLVPNLAQNWYQEEVPINRCLKKKGCIIDA